MTLVTQQAVSVTVPRNVYAGEFSANEQMTVLP